MKRVVAGVLSRRAEADVGARARLERAFEGLGSFRVFEDGPLTVAWTTQGDERAVGSDDWLCVLDGTIYNLPAVLGEAGLAGGDVPGAGPSAEAMLAVAYSRRGEAMLARLRGDFALLCWNRRTHEGILVRDQLGCGSVAWSETSGGLVFASEVSHLLALLPRTPGPDHAAVAHWLARSGQPGGRTLYDGVFRLRPSHLLALGPAPATPRRYWSPRYERPLRASREEAVQLVSEALMQSVHRRCAPGETTGVLLSGGVDSSTVAAFAARQAGGEVRKPLAYSAVFPTFPPMDEGPAVELLVDALGLKSTRIAVRGGSILAGGLSYLARWALPPASPNMFFWEPLMHRAAQDGVTTLLTGEGGDELFGLSPYLLADRLRRGRVLSAIELARRFPGASEADAARVRAFIRGFGLQGAAPPFVHVLARRFKNAGRYQKRWMRPATAAAWLEADESFAWKRLPGPRWWAYLVEEVIQGIGPELVYDHTRQRAQMGGMESRCPLVDIDLVEQVLRLPPELAFDPRWSRPLQRELTSGLVPDVVRLRRAKPNFNRVFHAGLTEADLPIIRELLGDPRAEVGAYVDLEEVRNALLDAIPRDFLALAGWSVDVWRMLTLECWLRAQKDAGFVERLRADGRLVAADYEFVE